MKTMKHFSLFLVLVVLTVSVFSICAFAGTDGSLDWSVSGGTLSITGDGMMDNYTLELLPEWYVQKADITSVTIDADVKSIGSYAFYGLTNLSEITVEGNITSVGYGAFEGTKLVKDGYVQIGENFVLVKVEDKTIPSFTIKDNTVAIAEGAFENCTSLTSIAIPETVVSIGDEAFKGCTSLSEITFAVTPDYLGVSAFDGCPLKTTEENGALYIADGKILLSVTSDDVTTVVINENTEVIAPLAFDNCKNLTNIVLPNKIKYIGNAAFYGCSSLYSVTLPDSIVAVGDLAFSNCTALTAVDLKDVKVIGNGAFRGDVALKEVVIPATVESLGYNAFRDCTSLTTVGIANGVKSIGYKTFEGCTALLNVYLPDSLVSIGDYAFMNCSSMKSIALPTTMKEVGFGAFASCSALETITLPFVDENTYIGYAFGAVNAESNAKAVPTSLKKVLAYGTLDVDFDNVIYDKDLPATLTASISNANLQMGEMIDLSTITATLDGIDTTGLVRLDSNPVVNPGETTTIKVYVGSRSADVSVSYTDEISFTDYNLLLEGNIGVKVYVQLTPYTVSNISELEATVGFKDNTETVELVNAGKADNPNLYYIKYNIAAKEMLEDITFTVKTPDAEITKTVTVKEYVDAINGNDNYKDSVALINAMYDFGEYARKYFIGGDIAPKFDVTTATVTISDSVKAVKSGSVDGIQIYSSSLLFESNTSIRHYFKLTGNKTIDEYTFTLDDGSKLTAKEKGDYYYVEVSDIPSHKLDKIRMVTVSDGTSTANYFYSPLTYAKIVIDRNLESDFDLVNALKAFYFYFNESKDYYDLMNKVEVTPGENEAPGQIW